MGINSSFKPVRKPRPVYGSVSGYFAFRGEETIWFESTLERDLLQKLEFNSNVMQVICQPVEIPYRTNLGRNSTYTPDFLVQFYSTPNVQKHLLIEVKPRDKLKTDWKRLKPKLKAGFEYAKQQGWDFKIFDESRIRDQFLANLKFLKRYQNTEFPKEDTLYLVNKLNQLEASTVNTLAISLYQSDQQILQAIAHIWALVAKKIISCDLTQALKPTTVIWLNNEFEHNLEGIQ